MKDVREIELRFKVKDIFAVVIGIVIWIVVQPSAALTQERPL
jgi:hypothetical protein